MANLKIGRIVLGICQTNCYFVYREGSFEVILFDPADRGGYIYDALKERDFTVAGILLTHGHFDHIWGADELREKSKAAVYVCEREKELCMDTDMNISAQMGRPCTLKADHYVKDGEKITVAGMSCVLLETPGHTEGSCCYYFEEDKILIGGDTLFCESVGRTDFPTGSMGSLVASIREKLFVLPEDVRVYPGHGEETTIGHEIKYNPFCQ